MRRDNVRLYRENHWTGDDRMLIDTVLPREPIPLMRAKPLFLEHDDVWTVGTVTNIHRGRWGWVLGNLTTYPDAGSNPGLDLTGLHCQADFDSHAHMAHTSFRTRRGTAFPAHVGWRLRAVTLGDHPCWKGMKIR